MAKFYLKDMNSDKPQLIYLRTKILGKEFKYSLGSSIKATKSEWDSENRKFNSTARDYKKKNEFLQKINRKFEFLCDEMLANKRFVCFDTIRQELDSTIHRIRKSSNKEVEKSFFDHWEDWINYLTQIRHVNTIDKKGYTLNSIKKFSTETGYKLKFETINRNFASKYKEWAFELVDKNGNPVFETDNTLNKYISIVKEFMKWCSEEGRNSCRDYKLIKNIEGEYFDVFALSKEDIKKLISIDFNNSSGWDELNVKSSPKKLELVRDGFVFRSLCGIRFSDFQNLDASNFQGNKLSLIAVKTRNPLFFELPPIAYEILKKYQFNIPSLDNGSDNSVLKEIGRIAGFNENFRTTRKRQGQLIYQNKKRWEILTTHVARKTFITNCLNSGMQQHVVMTLAGIKKPGTLMRYIQVTNKDIERETKKLHDYLM